MKILAIFFLSLQVFVLIRNLNIRLENNQGINPNHSMDNINVQP